MVTRFPAFTKVREGRTPRESFAYDEGLFPIRIPTELHGEQIAQLAIPPILRNKFDQHLFTRLGQLEGMTPDQFLLWQGFGGTCLKSLCHMLASLNTGGIPKLPSAEYDSLSKSQLPADVLEFAFDKLNVPILLKTQLRNEFGIQRVSHFIDAYETGKLSRPNLGTKTLEQIWAQVAVLANTGAGTYLKEISLDSRTFLEIIQLIREKLSSREQVIFDHRFCPLNVEFLTLEVLGKQLDLTRERIRQIEKGLVKGFQSGTLREFGWLIRRQTLELFEPSIQQLGFEALLNNTFFSGVPSNDPTMPAAFVFLDRVFYSTFTVKKDTVTINQQVQRRRNFT